MAGAGRDSITAFGTGGPFEGFAPADFDAYLPKKWTSNAYTLERRKAKDKLLALCDAVRSELSEELGQLDFMGSEEMPTVANGRSVRAQWAFFLRPAEVRSGLKSQLNTTDLAAGAGLFDIAVQHQHACLTLRLDQDGVAVTVEFAAKAKVDRDNAAAKLANDWAQTKLVELCAELPGSAVIGVGDATKAAIETGVEDVQSWLEPLQGGADLFRVEVLVPRDEPIVNEDALIGTVVELVNDVLPIYRYLAWSDDNDHCKLRESMKKTEQTKKKEQLATLKPGDRVTILSGLFAGRPGYLAEVSASGKAKVMVGPVSVSVDAKDLKSM